MRQYVTFRTFAAVSNLAPDAALVLSRVSAKLASDVAAWSTAKAVPGVEADVLKMSERETTVPCHEAANSRPKEECVKCTACPRWFHSNCVVKKFNDDVATIRANPVWTCWHCRGVCCLHSCVAKREGGKIANTIESDVGNGAKYFTLITEATVAGYTSVRAHFDAIDHEKNW